jgi:hypothetical protein
MLNIIHLSNIKTAAATQNASQLIPNEDILKYFSSQVVANTNSIIIITFTPIGDEL